MWVTMIATVIVDNVWSVWTSRQLEVFDLPIWTAYLGLVMFVWAVIPLIG
ncbi:hypothetical protein [Alicyclobacillus tolerans]|uniref:Uncharacterized protein n=1 Tax=Alicyclobacillus tolerans TaxID=90970 RepID=A0ABT9LTU8_9BACL|nr:hypothetical protein [Alicyclobacillus tengchongensis]MDP9727682.1 hypothetical protein [Alicyclobacillus tengchongensis]